jgi:hypothetical protein
MKLRDLYPPQLPNLHAWEMRLIKNSTMSIPVPLWPRDVKFVNAVLHSVEEPFPEERKTPTLAQHLRTTMVREHI